MSNPSPAALSAAAEIYSVPPPGRPSLQYMAEIIDRHMAPMPTQPAVRYFTDGVLKWRWENGSMLVIGSAGDWSESIFNNPDELIVEIDVIETDENGKSLAESQAELD